MATTAAALLAAFNGKSVPIPGVSNGGSGSPFGIDSAQVPNPITGPATPGSSGFAQNQMAGLQDQVGQSQSDYQNQQAANRAQLFANIKPASVGGGGTIYGAAAQGGNGQTDPFGQFNDAISSIRDRGTTATAIAGTVAQGQWDSKLQSLNDQYKANSATASKGWDPTQIGTMLGNVQGQMPTGADLNNPGAKAVMLAQQVVKGNVPYVWGGNSLTKGVDCSGLVQQVYGRIGIQLPRTSTEQAKFGKVVPNLAQALPGDLILEYSPYEPAGLQQYGHVGIYLGNGMVIEAPGTGKNVRVGPIVNMTRIVRPW